MFSFMKYIYDTIVSTDNVKNPTTINDGILRENYAKLSEQCKEYDETHTEHAISNEDEYEKSDCLKLVGLVTALESKHGIINKDVCFELSAAKDVVGRLSVGCKVSFLAYKSAEKSLKVVAIIAIINESWEVPSINEVIYIFVYIYIYIYFVQLIHT